jgi:hypothetical protein
MSVTNFGTSAVDANKNDILQEALSAYTDEAYTAAKKLSSTAIIGSMTNIDPSTETFIGQTRWRKPITMAINVASLTDATAGTTSQYEADYLKYVKTVRTYGGEKVNMREVVTQEDGLAKLGRDFGEVRAQDEHNAILAMLKGVAVAEALNGAATGSGSTGLGGQTFDNDTDNSRYGFYVDLASAKPVIDATSAVQGAARAEGFLKAFGMAYKDYEPEFAYLVTSPETYASLRSANLIDADRVIDGSIAFSTIFNGKFRLLQTRASQSFSTAELTAINTGAGVDIVGTKTSFIVLPSALGMAGLNVPMPVEIYRTAASYNGGGTTQIWNRWGYILTPAGYSWNGSETAFASDTTYGYVVESGTPKPLTGAGAFTTIANVRGTWTRKTSSALSLGILPVFHG